MQSRSIGEKLLNNNLVIYLLLSLFFFIVIAMINGLIAMLIPTNYGFHYTHWILGRLTGLWEYDFLVDIGITSLFAALVMILLSRRYIGK
ncbi:MAG: hypothetical protein ACE5KA_07875 [Nitrososphaerales archaeon]